LCGAEHRIAALAIPTSSALPGLRPAITLANSVFGVGTKMGL